MAEYITNCNERLEARQSPTTAELHQEAEFSNSRAGAICRTTQLYGHNNVPIMHPISTPYFESPDQVNEVIDDSHCINGVQINEICPTSHDMPFASIADYGRGVFLDHFGYVTQYPATCISHCMQHPGSVHFQSEAADGFLGDALAMQQVPTGRFTETNSLSEDIPISPAGDYDKKRYVMMLQWPTAMLEARQSDPVTYLDAGETYSLVVIDTRKSRLSFPCEYHVFVHVSFDDSVGRENPAPRWRMSRKSGSYGTTRHRAVRFVDTDAQGIGLVEEGYNGFHVTWCPSADKSQCQIRVSFDFVSSDFNVPKGTPGKPQRLCAMVYQAAGCCAPGADAMLAYCKVKLYRRHGARRRLKGDAKKVECELSEAKSILKRTRRRDGAGSGGQEYRSHIRDLEARLQSAQPTSILSWPGEPKDHPSIALIPPWKIEGGSCGSRIYQSLEANIASSWL